jgi:hypothetical protein
LMDAVPPSPASFLQENRKKVAIKRIFLSIRKRISLNNKAQCYEIVNDSRINAESKNAEHLNGF